MFEIKKGKWIIGWICVSSVILFIVGAFVYKVDPYMHYHKPYTDKYFYGLDNERTQNNGIVKYFDYDAIITGTSMTENFKTSEMDELFGTNSIKVSYSGATFKEVNDNLKVALKYHPNTKYIVRGLDLQIFMNNKNAMRSDMGKYPMYLYDSNPFNDAEYLFNRDVYFKAYIMVGKSERDDYFPGITSFDDYANWDNGEWNYGTLSVYPGENKGLISDDRVLLNDDVWDNIQGNIQQNVVELVQDYPEVEFLYFIPPYSISWWETQESTGVVSDYVEIEKYVIERLLEYSNVKLYAFGDKFDIVNDLNNYKDVKHYGPWINSLILKWMHDGVGLITKDNYEAYLEAELKNYFEFDYSSLNNQVDYEDDYYAAALLNEELTGVAPRIVVDSINSASVEVPNVDDYTYLTLNAENMESGDALTVYVYADNGEALELSRECSEEECKGHQFVFDIKNIDGDVVVSFNNADNELEYSDSDCTFYDVVLY